jgi:hypothetical protein
VWLFSRGFVSIFGYALTLAAIAAFTFIGKALRSLGQKMQRPRASELRLRDERKPVVFLRSFQDDDLNVVQNESRGKATKSGFEVGIEDQFTRFGPFVAIGRPGESLPALGAAREYYGDTEWKEAVAEWIEAALILLVIPGLTEGVRWEMELIRNKRYLNKLLVLMPPRVETDEKPTWSNLRVSWSLSFRHGLQRVENFAGDESYKLTLRWQQLRAALKR